MARRYRPRSTPAENFRIVLATIPWRLLIVVPLLLLVAIPAFIYGIRLGAQVLPGMTNYFLALSSGQPSPTPTPLPTFSSTLPQPGSVLYTVQSGENCDEILTYHMHMVDAGQVFSDSKPETVRALNAAVGQDCHTLQPGMVLPLSPHYPLVAIGGLVLKIDATSPQQVLPTPVIKVQNTQQVGPDCSGGCLLTVRIANKTQVHLLIQTTLPIHVGSWVWAQASLARKNVANFANYPYVDPNASLDGMSLRACDLQVDNTHDDNSLSCTQLQPNTIEDDGGSWLFGVIGSSSLDHWHYPLNLPSGTRVLLWLSIDKNGDLVFRKGNDVYRYDEGSHTYIKV